jgi:hypothetical protein
MKLNRLTLAAILCLLLLTVAGWTIRSRAQSVPTWEYRVESLYDDAAIQKNLNVLGMEGWQLVAFEMRGAPNKNGREGFTTSNARSNDKMFQASPRAISKPHI